MSEEKQPTEFDKAKEQLINAWAKIGQNETQIAGLKQENEKLLEDAIKLRLVVQSMAPKKEQKDGGETDKVQK